MREEERRTEDRIFMERAVSEARRCVAEDARPHPKVGAVVVKAGASLGSAFRGELTPGEHAEFTLLEKKLKDSTLTGATVYTTLEPCTTRSHPKVPCADRLVERGVTRVMIGTLDPNPEIRGSGVLRLREARVSIEFFDSDLMLELEELNREFTRAQRRLTVVAPIEPTLIASLADRSLQDWYVAINRIYWNRNFHLRPAELLAHLVEVVGGLSCVASRKRKPGVDADAFVAKAVAWWLVLCGKVGVRNVEEMLWDKFPGVCPYCRQEKCLGDECGEMKAQQPGPLWATLAEMGQRRELPRRIGDWQTMFAGVYAATQVASLGAIFGRLTEELGELAEAVRVFPAEPGYFLSEAADVFAWLMHVQNSLDAEARVPRPERGRRLQERLARAYPDSCTDCGGSLCSCPPILASTIGRIAHEVPAGRGSFGNGGRFNPPDKMRKLFQHAGSSTPHR